MKLFFQVLGNDYQLCYTNSPKHTIKYYLAHGWKLEQLKLKPMIKETNCLSIIEK